MKKNVKIGNKLVGDGSPAFIIAEVGSNHNGNLAQAKKLIDIAADSRVDAVKFQIFKAENFYEKKNPMFKVMKENELPRNWLKELNNYAAKKEVVFLASPFDEEAIDLLQVIGCPAIKWASSETVNLPLLRYAASKKKPLLISTAMCNLADIYEAVDVAVSAGNDDIVLLQCTALYPTPPQHVHLNVMDALRKTFHCPVGYSDHTLGFSVPIAAVAKRRMCNREAFYAKP